LAERTDGNDLDELGLDVFVEHELREDDELFLEKLVGEVYGRVHDAGAVRADRVRHVTNVDRVEMLVVARPLHENLTTPTDQRHAHSTD